MEEHMMVTQLSVADQMSIGTVSSSPPVSFQRQGGRVRDVQMYSDAFRPDRATVRTIPQTPALSMLDLWHNTRTRWMYSQYPKTETTGNRDLLLTLHVEVPDNEPWENGKGEVGSHEPRLLS